MASLFIVGSICFAVGSFPPISRKVDPGTVGLVFFISSIVFTAAAALQFLAEVEAERTMGRDESLRLGHGGSWWAGLVQLADPLFFNISTLDALLDGLSTEQTNRLVWAPDVFGSIAFLIASTLAWRDVYGRF